MSIEHQRCKVAQDGTITVPEFDLPLSVALSDQYRTMLAFLLSSGFRMDFPAIFQEEVVSPLIRQ